jgi:galactonate dehydratase
VAIPETSASSPSSAASSGERIARFRAFQAQVSPATAFLFFEVETSAGRVGTGEATMSRDDEGTTRLAQGLFDEHALGRDVGQIPAIVASCAAATGTVPSRSARTALSGLEHCLVDLRGQVLGLPVYELLGGLQRDRVPLYANINRGMFGRDRSPEAFAETAVRAREAGFPVIKIAPFDGVHPDTEPTDPKVREGLARIAAVRRALGDQAGIYVNCHERLSVEICHAILPELVELDIAWLQHPFVTEVDQQTSEPVQDPPGSGNVPTTHYQPVHPTQYQELARRSPIPLSGSSSEFGLQGYKDVLDVGALSYAMVDVKHCGGIQEARAIGELAGSYGVKISPHNPSGPISTIASMHVCLATPSFGLLEYQWGEVPEREKMITPGEGFDRGWLVPNGKPGLGVALDHQGLAAHASSVTKLAG